MQELEGPNPSDPFGRWYKAKPKPPTFNDIALAHAQQVGDLLSQAQTARDYRDGTATTLSAMRRELADKLATPPPAWGVALRTWAGEVSQLRLSIVEVSELHTKAVRDLAVAEDRALSVQHNAPERLQPTLVEQILGRRLPPTGWT